MNTTQTRLEAETEMILRMVGNGSTIEAMCAATLLSSTQSVHKRLRLLQERGLITIKSHVPCGRQLTLAGLQYLGTHALMDADHIRAYQVLYAIA